MKNLIGKILDCINWMMAIIFLVSAGYIFLIYGCNDDDRKTEYYSRWETCQVESVTNDIVTLECNGVRRKTTTNDPNLHVGNFVKARSDYEVYTEIQDVAE